MSDWHLAWHLSKLAPVLYVDPPMSRLTPLRNQERPRTAGARLRLEGPGLARLTPVVHPFPSRPGTTGMTSALIRHYLRRATARLGGRVRAVISGWPQYSVFGSCEEEKLIYWAKDDFVGGSALLRLNAKMLDRRERQVAASATFSWRPIRLWLTPGAAAASMRCLSPSEPTRTLIAGSSTCRCRQTLVFPVRWPASSAESMTGPTCACWRRSRTGAGRFSWSGQRSSLSARAI